MSDILLISLVAGLLALDDSAGWQSLLGEPVFSAVIVGALTHQLSAALLTGVALQFVWLTIGAARGTRRPNVVVGGVVGVGAACLVLKHTADMRVEFVVAVATFFGLLAGEAGAVLSRAGGQVRERWLARFRLPDTPEEASRDLTVAVLRSALVVILVDALSVLVLLPIATGLTDAVTGRLEGAAAGARLWLAVLPAFAIATVARAFASKTLVRYAAVGMLVVVGLAWLL
jgi:mannose/fructose/N-acetylgalactosamine-specific phosphotransferase system component IIC